jgi:hypothetical protein
MVLPSTLMKGKQIRPINQFFVLECNWRWL